MLAIMDAVISQCGFGCLLIVSFVLADWLDPVDA